MDMMGGLPCLFVYDIQVDKDYQRKGLGRHLLILMELIARREGMERISLPVQLGDEATVQWLSKIARGFTPDYSIVEATEGAFDAEMEVINCKSVCNELLFLSS